MKSIHSLIYQIEDFCKTAPLSLEIEALVPLATAYKGDDWKNFVKFKDDCYSRNYVHQCQAFEILILCWKPQQGSPVHNHAERGCVLKVLSGELTETQFYKNGHSQEKTYKAAQISYIHNHIGVHKVENKGSENAVSLHIYAPGFFVPQILGE
jgi:cysteine dioxygenase